MADLTQKRKCSLFRSIKTGVELSKEAVIFECDFPIFRYQRIHSRASMYPTSIRLEPPGKKMCQESIIRFLYIGIFNFIYQLLII